MEIFKTIPEIRQRLHELKLKGNSIGFVPTMGALHKGHISLVERAVDENDIVVCSIFVNPIQFNNKEDLEKYPRTIDTDIKMLEKYGCDILFFPDNDEMYPEADNTVFDFGQFDKILEGKYRPGHFNGVAIVVKKLFEIIEPDKAYFGKKDYQQLAIIKKLVEYINSKITIIGCSSIREDDGLAMSSRNMRLTAHERSIAPQIYRILSEIKALAKEKSLKEVKQWAVREFEKYPEFRLEYFEIADPDSLLSVDNPVSGQKCIALVALYLGDIRLIDNMEIIF